MAEHLAALKTVFTQMREPWWNEDKIEDLDTDTDRRLEAEARRNRQGGNYKTFPNQSFIEVMFMMLHGFSLMFVPCYMTLSITLIGWVSSVESITQDDQAVTPTVFNQTLIGDGMYDMHLIGVTYFMFSVFLLVTTLITIKVTFNGNARRIKLYLFVNFLGFFCEIALFVWARVHAPMNSCQLDSLRHRLQFQMSWYGLINVNAPIQFQDPDDSGIKSRFLGYEAILKMDSIQDALGCCGIDGYEDYKQMNENLTWFPEEAQWANYTVRTNPSGNHRELDSIPHTCCKPIWKENIYCAEEIYEQEDLIKQRINENGCFKEAEKLCENVLYMINVATLRILLLRVMFFIFAIWMLRYILQLLALEKIRAFEALLDMQRPNLEGFDLADALTRIKPIASKTQALPGQRLSKGTLQRMASVSTSERTEGLLSQTSTRRGSIWDEHQRLEKVSLYRSKTRDQVEKYSSLLKEELGEVPLDLNLEEESSLKLPHHHHHRHHHHHKTISATDLSPDQALKPSFPTMSTAIGKLAFSGSRHSNKVHPYSTKVDKSEVALARARSQSQVQPETEPNAEYLKPWPSAAKLAQVTAQKPYETIAPAGGFKVDDESEYYADEEEEEEEGTKSRDRRRHHRYDQHYPEGVGVGTKPSETLQVIFDRQHQEEMSQIAKVQTLGVHTSDFGDDRVSLITTESAIKPKPVQEEGPQEGEPKKKRKKKKKRAGTKKTTLAVTEPEKKKRSKKKPQGKQSWDSLWWTGH